MDPQTPSALQQPKPAQIKPAEQGNAPPPRRRRRWVWLLILILLGAALYFLWPKIRGLQTASAPSETKATRPSGTAPPITPVIAARAQKGNIGVYYTGLGAVTPIYTVTVKTRVDGQLMEVLYKEGDMVHEGDLLARIDDRPFAAQLTQFEGQLLRDQALLANARIDLARYQTLLAQNAVPEQQVATQKATVTQDEGIVKTDQGQIESAKVNLVYCRITAPITGRIGLRLVDPGNIVHASDTTGLLVITQLEPISVIFTIAEDQVPVVLQKERAGQRLRVDAYDRELKTKLAQGWLTTLDNEIDQTTGTLKLRATFDNKRNELFPNQFVNARLLVQEKHGVTLIPTAAVQRNSQQTYVYVVKPDSTVTVRTVTPGVTEGDETEIASGVAPGDVVVMTGVDRLQEGSKVNVHLNEDATHPARKQAPGGRSK